jgi:hypothetical protein
MNEQAPLKSNTLADISTGVNEMPQGNNKDTHVHIKCNRSSFNVFIPVVCWAPVDLDPREMVTPGSSNR